MFGWIAFAALILIGGFFTAAQTAVVSLSDARLRQLAEDGHKKAARVLALTARPTRFLTAMRILSTVSVGGAIVLAVALGIDPLAGALPAFPAARPVAGLILGLVSGFLALVLVDLLPSRLGAQRDEPLAFATVGILRAATVVLTPLSALAAAAANGLTRLFGIDPHADDEKVTEEEIRLLVDVGEEKGVIEGSQKEMINNIFEFDDISAEEIMTPRTDLAALEADDPIEDALKLGVDEGYSRLPVYEEDIDHIIGILYIKDLLPYVGRKIPAGVTVRHLLREAYFVPGTKRCGALFTEMTEKHTQVAVVVDEYGGVAGIVTMEDLLESIVGNIQDEYDHEEEEVCRTGENSFEVDGAVAVDELEDELGVALPEGDYDTLAGFLLDRLGRLPADGEQPEVSYPPLTFTVLRVVDRRIERVRIVRQPPETPGEDE
ncbi:MAG: hemolysin family protein [Acutalibacteraceae bacterium]